MGEEYSKEKLHKKVFRGFILFFAIVKFVFLFIVYTFWCQTTNNIVVVTFVYNEYSIIIPLHIVIAFK